MAVKFSSATPNPEIQDVQDISPEELNERASEVFLVDVRRDDEYNADLGHIANTTHIVLDTLPDHMDKIPKDKTIVFICRSGARSARAAAFAQEEGYSSAYNMKGGMLRWNQLGFKVERT